MDINASVSSDGIFVKDPAYHRFCLALIPFATVIGNALVITLPYKTRSDYRL